MLGIRKRVDAELAKKQWHAMAQTLLRFGNEVIVIPPNPNLTGLVYPANAGFLYPLEADSLTVSERVFYLANLLPTRAGEREIYERFIQLLGFRTAGLTCRQEGEADFFPAGRYMIFTYGRLERQRFVPRAGWPPWKRIYGFRSEERALGELSKTVRDRPIVSVELCLEAHYHGDTVLCSFGHNRESLLVYRSGISPKSFERLHSLFADHMIELSQHDAELYAANSFQSNSDGQLQLFMPEGISDALARAVRDRGVEPVLVKVSEFLAKGGGSIKCMILDLGPSEQMPKYESAKQFQKARSYQSVFKSQ